MINEDTARDLVREWGVDKMHDAVIVEPWAGASWEGELDSSGDGGLIPASLQERED